MIQSIARTPERACAFTIIVGCALGSIVLADANADAAGTEANGTWTWKVTKTVDPILDSPAVVATLPGRPGPGMASSGQNLRLACTDGTLRASIRWGATPDREWTARDPGQAEVLVRFGESAPTWQHWRRPAGRPVTEASEPGAFMKHLGAHRTVALRVYPSEERPITVVFDLTEVKPVIEEVMGACRTSAERKERVTAGLAELRSQAEAERKRVEEERRGAERERIEAARKKAEAERERIEAARKKAEAERERIEAARKKAEAERERIEAARKKAEAELKRIEAARYREAERALQEAIALDARLDAEEIEYIAQIKRKIERNWLRPPGTAVGLKCVVRVSQIPGGEVVQAEIQSSSGSVAFDRSVEEAVLRASPLPVPNDPSLFDRNIVITFEPEA